MSYYSKSRTQSKSIEKQKIEGDRLFYEMFYRKGMKILDIGCSTGTFVLNDPANITGIDADADSVKIAVKKGLNCKVFNADGNILPFKSNSFDAVNLKSVLAHVYYPKDLVKDIKRVLKPKGKLIIFTANIKVIKWDFFEDYTHVSPFTLHSLRQLLNDAGFENAEIYNFPMRMVGMGLLYRMGVSPGIIHSIEKFIVNSPIILAVFRIFDNRVNIIANAHK